MRDLLDRTVFVILATLLLAGGSALSMVGTAEASAPAETTSVGAELANGERPASVALTTSYALMALTLEPLAAAARGEEATTQTGARPEQATRTAAASEARRRTGHVIDVTASPLLDGWLVRLVLALLGGLIVLTGVLELNSRAGRRPASI